MPMIGTFPQWESEQLITHIELDMGSTSLNNASLQYKGNTVMYVYPPGSTYKVYTLPEPVKLMQLLSDIELEVNGYGGFREKILGYSPAGDLYCLRLELNPT